MHPVWRRLLLLVPIILAITAWHVWDAARKGEAVWVPIVAVLIPLAILGGIGFLVSRPVAGLTEKQALAHRSARLAGLAYWAGMLAAAAALLRLVAYLAERRG